MAASVYTTRPIWPDANSSRHPARSISFSSALLAEALRSTRGTPSMIDDASPGNRVQRHWPVGSCATCVVRDVGPGWAPPARATPDRGPRPGPRRRRRAGRRGGQRRRPGMSRAAARGRRSDANALTTGATPSRKVLWPTGKADRPWLLQRRRIHDVSSDSRGRARTCAYEWASTGWAESGGI